MHTPYLQASLNAKLLAFFLIGIVLCGSSSKSSIGEGDLDTLKKRLTAAVASANTLALETIVADLAKIESAKGIDILIRACLDKPMLLHGLVVKTLQDMNRPSQW